MPDPGSRAILLQSEENRREVARLLSRFDMPSLRDENAFGENVVVRGGLTPDLLCVGDLLEVTRSTRSTTAADAGADGRGADGVAAAVVLRMRVASPRWPCYKMDSRHPLPLTRERVRELKRQGATTSGLCLASGLAGVFCSVCDPGTVAEGDVITVVERPHPTLTCRRVSELCYGHPLSLATGQLEEFNGAADEQAICCRRRRRCCCRCTFGCVVENARGTRFG